jgi:hypothetical protein
MIKTSKAVNKERHNDQRTILRGTQRQQHLRMLPPTTLSTLTGGITSSTPYVQPFSTPSTGLRTRELHGPGYYHVCLPTDPGYAEQMRAMYGRDDVEPPRRDPPSLGSSSQGTSSQSIQRAAWHFQAAGSFLPLELILERLLPEAYEGDFGEHGGPPVHSIYPSVAAP